MLQEWGKERRKRSVFLLITKLWFTILASLKDKILGLKFRSKSFCLVGRFVLVFFFYPISLSEMNHAINFHLQ